MDVEELKNIRDFLKISREEMAERLSISINALGDWEYKKKRVPKGKVKLIEYVFNTYFENKSELGDVAQETPPIYETPTDQLEEKERSIYLLQRTIQDKEELLNLCRQEVDRLKKEIYTLKKNS